MIKKRITSLLFSLLLLCNCSTYTSFYSKTHDTLNNKNINSIHRLDFSNQNLSKLPSSIASIKNLRMINLSNNKNLNLEETFQELMQHKNLEILILDSLNIIKLPDAIKSLSNLKQLSLINNPKLDLVQIFDQLSELHIEFLNLKNNNISLLPENITKLQKIKDLNLSFNVLQHKKNYEYLSKLPLLYSLWIDHNNLKELPETIGALSQIRFLYIDHNSLEKLPEKITEMKKVWVIHAGYNRFRRLPPEFVKMKALLMVHINNNQITTIPNVYETEKYPLAGLLLDNNPINDIEINRVKNIFKGFFLLSFEQKKYD